MRAAAKILGRTIPILRSNAPLRVLSTKTSARRKSKDNGVDTDAAKKERILDDAIKQLNSDYGKGHLMKLGEEGFATMELTSSGALTLDIALGGGYPVGKIVEIYGPESAGKTSIALHAMAEVQKTGGKVVLIDAENSFNLDYAKKLGLNVEELYMCQPTCGEEALETVDRLARTGSVGMICVDSVSALMPKAEISGEIGASQVGTQARMMSQALRRLVESAGKYKCTIVFINQIRFKIGVLYGNPETTSGGNALKFYASVRIDVRRKEYLGADKENPTGIKIKCKVVKNKVAPPFRVADVDLLFGSGIDQLKCVVDAAEQRGIIKQAGSYYSKGDVRLGHGKERTLEFLRNDLEMQNSIREEIFASLKRVEADKQTTEETDAESDDSENGTGFLDIEPPPEDNPAAA